MLRIPHVRRPRPRGARLRHAYLRGAVLLDLDVRDSEVAKCLVLDCWLYVSWFCFSNVLGLTAVANRLEFHWTYLWRCIRRLGLRGAADGSRFAWSR